MALTRITKGVIKPNENYDTHNINSTGIVTAIGLDVNGNGDISGNLSVGGVLTYEDVTSIDSVGIITAQSDIHVGAGLSVVGVGSFGSLDIGGDIDVDGHTNLDNVSISGVTTFASNVHLGDNDKLIIGDHSDIQIYNDGTKSVIENGGYSLGGNNNSLHIYSLNDILTNSTYSQYFHCGAANKNSTSPIQLALIRNAGVKAYYNNNLKLETSPNGVDITGGLTVSGIATFTGAITANGAIDLNSDLDVDGHTNLDNVSVAGVTTFTGRIDASDNIAITSGNRLYFGNSDVAFIKGEHGGSGYLSFGANNEHMRLTRAGNLGIGTDTPTTNLQVNDASNESTISLYNAGTKKVALQASNNFGSILYSYDDEPLIFSVHSGSSFSEKLRIDSSGVLNVPAGIGPQLRFENQHSVTTDAVISTFDDASGTLLCLGSNFYINSSGGETRYNTSEESSGIILNRQGYINLNTGGTGTNALNRIQITEVGKVQIGLPGNTVSLPGGYEVVNIRAMDEGNLHVRAIGNLMSAPSGSGVGLDVLNNAGNAVKDLCIRGAVVAFRSATAETLRITSGGDILIGRTTELTDAKVSIQCDAGESGIAVQLNTNTGISNLLQAYSSAGPNVASITVNPDATPDLMFNVWDGSSTAERLRITSTGYLKVTNGSTSDFNTIQRASTSNYSGIRIQDADATQRMQIGVAGGLNNICSGAQQHDVVLKSYANLLLATNQTERLRITSAGNMGVGTNNPVAKFVVSKANGEGVEFVPGNRTDENDIYHYDRGSNVYCSYRTYAAKHEFWRAGSTQAVEVTPAGNLKVYHGAGLRLATQPESHSDYVNFETDNHGNTVVGLNLALNYSGSSGTHQVKQVNAHSSIGSAGMFIGGNGSANVTDICFFRNSQGNSAQQVFGQNDWKFRIGSEIVTNNNLMHRMRGFFRTDTASQNATNGPSLAGVNSYAYGYQEAYSTSNGSWVHPYPDLVLGYHTGVSFGGHQNYNGCRFFTDHPSSSSTLIFSVGNGNSGVAVVNSLSKGGGSFRIAHPHPSKKYTHDLQHSFIEGPQCDNIYRGRVDLVGGSATVNIDTVSNMTDGTFVLLNRDIQCFTSNETGWTAVKGSVSGNILTITAENNSCTDTISWMVIGERQDDKIKSPQMEMTDSDGKLIVEPLTIEESHM